MNVFFQDYQNIIKTHDLQDKQIWNMDETHIRLLVNRRRLAGYLGGEQPVHEMENSEEHKTSCMFINAAGDHMKSTIILPLKCVPPLTEENMSNFDYSFSDSGWIEGKMFKTMIEEVFLRRLEKYKKDNNLEGKYTLLVLDNHSSRNFLDVKKLYDDHQLIISFIPPHSSALLQPLDLGPNLTLKQIYSKLYLPDINDDSNERRNKSLSALHLAESHAMSKFTIVNSWKRSGLWPVNSSVVTKSCMVKPERNTSILSKRGAKMESGSILIDGTTIVQSGQPDKENIAPPNKKARKATNK